MKTLKLVLTCALIFCISMIFAQTKHLTGTISDESGEPIIGASVMLKGTTTGTVTGVDGDFSLNVPEDGKLVISYIGYRGQEIPVAGKNVVSIILQEDTELLDEVVVVGYGVQRKASLTSAISQIKADEALMNKGVNNVSVALQGEIPGLVVTRNSTRPGSEGAEMKIRGDISINGNSSPLVLIDGIAGSLDELNQMEPSDIENITVLKDASAAIYGARSASGVLLITTKRGKKGGARITYNGSVSTTIDGIRMPITSNAEWLDMFYDAQYRDAMAINPTISDPDEIRKRMNWWILATNSVLSGTIVETGEAIGDEVLWQALRDGKTMNILRSNGWVHRYEPDNYIMDELYEQATSHKHSLNISGADDKFGYMASLGFADNQSQLRVAEDGEKKYSGRLNMDYQATDILKFETGMSYEVRDITTPSTDVGAGWADPWLWSFYSKTGNFYDSFDGKRSPLGGLIAGGHVKTGFTTLRGNLKATLDLSQVTQGLSLSATAGYKSVGKNIQTLKNRIQYYDWEDNPTGNKQGPGSLAEEINTWKSITLGAFADYNRVFNQIHNVSAMAGMTSEEENWKKVVASRNNGPLYGGSGLVDLEAMISHTNNGAGGGQSSWAFLSYITRLNYNYDNRYLVEFLGRRDGSSKLSINQRWKNFYSVSGGWVLSNESFMRDINWLSNLKVRYNYGKTGNVTGIDNYERYAILNTGSAYFGQGPTLTAHPSLWLEGMTSDSRTWETIISHNAGVDFAFLRGRLSGSFDYFSKTNNGMFIPVSYPAVLGANAPKTNNGKFGANGWEFALNWRDKIGDVSYNIGGFIGDVKNKVITLENNENVPNPGKNSNRLIGKPRDSFYVYETAGIFSTQAEANEYYEKYYWNADHTGPKAGNILPKPADTGTNRLRPGSRILADRNGDGAITTKDTYYAGDSAPHYTFGFKLGMDYKGLDFQAFFQGVGQQIVLRGGHFRAPFATSWTLQNSSFIGKTWTEENTNTDYTVISRDGGFNSFNYDNKDISIQRSSYMRLKSLVIGYTIPNSLITKAGLSQLRVYVSGDDLWEWTSIKDGYDPEYGEQSNNTFPFSRLLSAGINISF
ncbi:MAG TPA: TonB-dependent receptor [Porphyromonadaceae bacterium]|nr:TonB-dependent receptor [Porphyromonadaceae bacterium]HCC19222.1 TonB-dependent receptor [Porphyromonadaceae bacterium]